MCVILNVHGGKIYNAINSLVGILEGILDLSSKWF